MCEPGPEEEQEALELDLSCTTSQLPAPASMEELSRWRHFNAAVVARELGPEGVQRYLSNASGLILNSDYSGMGGAEIGLHYGVAAMESLSAKPGLGLLASCCVLCGCCLFPCNLQLAASACSLQPEICRVLQS